MNVHLVQRLRSFLGGDHRFRQFIQEFGNKHMPGKKALNLLTREAFLAECNGKRFPFYAKKYSISEQTLRKWWREANLNGPSHNAESSSEQDRSSGRAMGAVEARGTETISPRRVIKSVDGCVTDPART